MGGKGVREGITFLLLGAYVHCKPYKGPRRWHAAGDNAHPAK